MNDRLTKAKYVEWQASLFGACFASFGAGIVLADMFKNFAYLLILTGVLMHGWGMYKIHQRNK